MSRYLSMSNPSVSKSKLPSKPPARRSISSGLKKGQFENGDMLFHDSSRAARFRINETEIKDKVPYFLFFFFCLFPYFTQSCKSSLPLFLTHEVFFKILQFSKCYFYSSFSNFQKESIILK